MEKMMFLVLAALTVILMSSTALVQALEGCFEGPLGKTCITSPGAFQPQKQGITCIQTVPEGLESCPCVQGQPPALYDNCGSNGALRCYCKKAEAAGAENKGSTSAGQSSSGGSASTNQSGSSSHWLWRIGRWPGRFVSAFSEGWHDLSNAFFDFLPFPNKKS